MCSKLRTRNTNINGYLLDSMGIMFSSIQEGPIVHLLRVQDADSTICHFVQSRTWVIWSHWLWCHLYLRVSSQEMVIMEKVTVEVTQIFRLHLEKSLLEHLCLCRGVAWRTHCSSLIIGMIWNWKCTTLYVSDSHCSFNFVDFCTQEILTEMAVGQAMQFRVKDTTPFRIFGLPKNILLEVRTNTSFSCFKDCLMEYF